MVKKLLKIDYALSQWFAGKKKKDRVVPGVVYFFSAKASFVGTIIFAIIIKSLDLNKYANLTVVLGMILVYIISTSLEKPVKMIIKLNNFEKDYKSLTQKQVYTRRFLALSLFALSLYSMIACLIIIF